MFIMKSSVLAFFLLAGLLVGNFLYVPMPTDMAAHFEFYWKTVGFRCCTIIMYIEYLFRGGSTIDFSIIQHGLETLTKIGRAGAPLTQDSKVTLEDTNFDGVRVLLYQQSESRREKRPALVYLHGGGLTIGSVDIYDIATRETAESLNDMVVVSVDYRLAPEHPFPAAYDDCMTATKWLLTHADDYGVDPTRVAVGGDSAGGYLTAAVVQAIHDDSTLPNIKLQIHLFPWLNHFDYQTPSYQKNRYTFGLKTWLPNHIPGFTFSAYFNGVLNDSLVVQMMSNNHTSAAFKNSALYRKTFDHSLIPGQFRDPVYYTPPSSNDFGDESIWNDLKDTLLDTRFSPILREDMSGLPPAYVVTCGFDPLRDDGIFFYHRLKAANVPAKWVNYEEAFHGVDWFGPMPSETGDRLRKGFVEFVNKHI